MGNAAALSNIGLPNGIPWSNDIARRDFDQAILNAIKKLQAALIQPEIVTNLRATALAGAIQIDFTRGDGDAYTLFINSTGSVNLATLVDLGTANKWIDQIGDGGITKYYAVQAKKGNVIGKLSPWLVETTLALGVAATPPEPPPGTQTPFTDEETDSTATQYPYGPEYVNA